jgi:mono/diheme cytochrome c family protein
MDPEQGGVGRAATALWTVSCAGCHGRDGRGFGGQRPPGAQMPDFTRADFQQTRTDEAIAQQIVAGKGLMPPFGKQVNEQGIAALIAHIRGFGAAAAGGGAVGTEH